jgi:3-oxoadipate enol-lactonase
MKATVNGIQVNYRVSGKGPWIILSHPVSANLEIWEPQINVLAENFSVLQYDIRGHGETEASEGPYPMVQLVDDAAHLLIYLGIEKAHWIGTSLGGMIGQAFAIKYPDKVDRMVLANTTCQAAPNAQSLWGERALQAEMHGMSSQIESTISRWFTKGFIENNPHVIQKIEDMIRTTSVVGYRGTSNALINFDLSSQLGSIKSSVLVIAGEHDQATALTMSQKIVSLLPKAQLVIVKDAAHISSAEQWEFFNKEVINFLTTADSSTKSHFD